MGHMVGAHLIFKKHQTGFQNDCIILHIYQQCMRVPVPPYPCQNIVCS